MTLYLLSKVKWRQHLKYRAWQIRSICMISKNLSFLNFVQYWRFLRLVKSTLKLAPELWVGVRTRAWFWLPDGFFSKVLYLYFYLYLIAIYRCSFSRLSSSDMALEYISNILSYFVLKLLRSSSNIWRTPRNCSLSPSQRPSCSSIKAF